MAGLSFGISKVKGKQPKKQLAKPLAAFAEPSDDHPALESLSEGQRDDEATRLQMEGNVKAEAGDYSTALRLWDQALIYAPKRAALHELKSQVFMEIDYAWEAIKSATQATELEPAWPEAFLTLARAQLSFGEPEEALVHMEKVLSLQPQHQEAMEEIPAIRALVLKRQQDPSSSGQRLRVT